ncbi:MAG: hypothetical protein M1821_004744 [Bathelium mastoideum]|nr:MAG: hypothetical protein M1821_004744 [Bathelium mastoideum]KAI9692153.1 MAG: hypothetical protein M1822_006383 [Bathelium mastoideum]
MYLPNSLWTWSFFVTALIQAITILALEIYVFGKFESNLSHDNVGPTQAKTIPTYLSLFIFGFLYQIALVYDALRLQNTIQVIGLCIYDVAMLVYAAVQVGQINDAVDVDQNLWMDVKPYLIAAPCVLGLGTVIMSFIAWKLYDEFAWKIYKHISADLRLKRRYLVYQIYIALLKFDFFLFLGFTVQFLVVVRHTTNVEFYLTIAAVPITIAALFLAAYWVRQENKAGMVAIIILYFAGLAYFLFKLFRMYYADSKRIQDYLPTRRSLTLFAVITVLMLVLTIVNAVWCTYNFNKGLKPHLSMHSRDRNQDFNDSGKPYQQEYGMPSVGSGQANSRMTID